jgi:hypothetical protein
MGMYEIIVSRGNFTNTVIEWHTCREEAVERAKEYLDWLGCTAWKVRKVG